MTTTLKQTDIKINPAEQKHIDQHVAKLNTIVKKYGTGVMLEIEVGRLSRHHRKGEIYHAECNLTLPKKLLRAEAEGQDVITAFEACRKELLREIDRYKTSKEEGNYRQARKLKKMSRMTPLAWRGEGREEEKSEETEEVY
ncbi:HPF/RaiA family ribosome-associated protein [Candidatus Uhrbacteria bacterium]|nr:HPF/RaiA family ribosome-associated protein [Candidatus Uhrbacteria bacterium]